MKNLKKLLGSIIAILSIGSMIEALPYHIVIQNASRFAQIARQQALVSGCVARAKAAQNTLSLFKAVAAACPENLIYKEHCDLIQVKLEAHEQSVKAAQKSLDKYNEAYKKSENDYKERKQSLTDTIKIYFCTALLVPIGLYEGYQVMRENTSCKGAYDTCELK